ncbi:hypothetical protein [Kosakonia oryziphila]|nr:hypothetical protein [Kosakonia oryziphila]
MDALRSQPIVKMPRSIFQASGDLLCNVFRIGGLRLDLNIVDLRIGTL